jgi:peptidoglycan/LPS O-acetylase OafA/YrhL
LERIKKGGSALRLDEIDMLRGVSILAVVLLHINIRMRIAGQPFASQFPPWLFHVLFTNGNNGVSVFFAISGFLITSTSLRRFGSLDRVEIATFYRIRFARIAPLLILLLVILSILHLVQAPGFYIPPTKTTLGRALFSALTFHLNWLEAVRGYLPANWDVLWSLSVEEAFYVFFPLVCLLLRNRAGTVMFFTLLSLLVVSGPFARTVWTNNDIWREKSYLGGADCIALGCLSAVLTNRLRKRRQGSGLLGTEWWFSPLQIGGAALLTFVALWPRWPVTRFIGITGLDGTLLALGTCAIAVPSALKRARGRIWTAPVRWLGRNSYEVYMTHEFIVVWAVAAYTHRQSGPQIMWIAVITAISALLGAAVAHYYSEPLNRRLRPTRPQRMAVETGPEYEKVF